MTFQKIFTLALCTTLSFSTLSSFKKSNETTVVKDKKYPYSLANYNDFKELVLKLEGVRYRHLIGLDTFNCWQSESNTIILDTRSRDMFNKRHIKGSVNLPFTEFTQNNLESLIQNKGTRILIYCNNNFKDDQIHFASKVYNPQTDPKRNKQPRTLALNIPTFLNLHGYGYSNVYELNELVSIYDERVTFEGSVPIAPNLKNFYAPVKIK